MVQNKKLKNIATTSTVLANEQISEKKYWTKFVSMHLVELDLLRNRQIVYMTI